MDIDTGTAPDDRAAVADAPGQVPADSSQGGKAAWKLRGPLG